MDLNHQVLNTIFSKYLALPIATFPFTYRCINFYIVIIFTRIEVKYGIGIKLKRVVKYETEKLNVKRELIKNST